MAGVTGRAEIGASLTKSGRGRAAKVLRRRIWVAAIVLLWGLPPAMACAGVLPVAVAGQQQTTGELPPLQDFQAKTMQGLLDQLQIPPSTVARFEAVYWRHRPELYRMVTKDPGLLWKTLGLVVDALPALQDVRNHQGRLILSQVLFARANDLWRQYERLASPALASDLRGIKKFIDRRTRRVDAKHVMIDLSS